METTLAEQPTQIQEPINDQLTQVEEPTSETVSGTDPRQVIIPGFSARYECVEVELVTNISRPEPDEGWQITESAQGCGTVPKDWTMLSFLVESISPDGEVKLIVKLNDSENQFHYLAPKPPYSGDDPGDDGYDEWRLLLVEEILE